MAGSSQRRNVAVLGSTFLLLFTAYSGIQNVATTLHPEHGTGSLSMGIIYATLVLVAPLAPSLVPYLGLKGSILLSIAGYWQFILANLSSSRILLSVSSALLGASGAMLWVSQAMYIVRAADAENASLSGDSASLAETSGGEELPSSDSQENKALGEFSGLFWGIYAVNQVLGNAVTFAVCLLLQPDASGISAFNPGDGLSPPGTPYSKALTDGAPPGSSSMRPLALPGLGLSHSRRSRLLSASPGQTLVMGRGAQPMSLPSAPEVHQSRRYAASRIQHPLSGRSDVRKGGVQAGHGGLWSVMALAPTFVRRLFGKPEVDYPVATPPVQSPEIRPQTAWALLGVFEVFMSSAAALAWFFLEEPPASVRAVAEGGGRSAVTWHEHGGTGPVGSDSAGDSKLDEALLESHGEKGRDEEVQGRAGASGVGLKEPEADGAQELTRERALCSVTFIVGIIPIMIQAGLQSAFISGDFTRYAVAETLGPAWIGATMTAFGISDIIACMLASGFARGLKGALWTLAMGIVCQLASCAILIGCQKYTATPLMAVALLWGVGEAALQSQLNALLPLLYQKNLDTAFAHWRMWSSGATSLLFCFSASLSFSTKTWLMLLSSLMALASVGVAAFTTSV